MHMPINVMNQSAIRPGHEPAPMRYEDPLDPDAAGDALIVTTRRSLLRVALVAAETASRFAREGLDADPMAWMLTPRRLFDGRAAIDGCLERSDCFRAILLHGLSIGLDADPVEIDALGSDDDEHEDADLEGIEDQSDPSPEDDGTRPPRLWTSLLVGRLDADEVQAFDAVVAGDRDEAEARLRARHGDALAGGIEVVEGFDPNLPLVEALVSSALSDMLVQVAGDPGSPLAKGLSVSVKQRFAA
jgi:hypothetical protein